MTEHTMQIEDLYKKLQTNPKTGLTNQLAKINLDLHGPNRLTPPKQTPEWVIFVRNVFSYFGILLWVGSLLCFLAYFIQSTAYEDPPEDNVKKLTFKKCKKHILKKLYEWSFYEILVMAGHCARRGRNCHGHLFLLPRIQVVKNHGVL